MAAWIALAVCTPAPALADEAQGELVRVPRPDPGRPFEVDADSLEYQRARRLWVARAGPTAEQVVLRQDDRELRADFAAYSLVTRRGVASGNVTVRSGGDELRAGFVEFDVDTLQGVLFDAELEGGETLRLRGGRVAKTGVRRYRFEDGAFTSCRCPDPDDCTPWELKAGSAQLEVEGHGTARDATFEVLGVPVGWLPWIFFPAKTKRSSGVLLPEFQLSGRNGLEVGLPFFAALGDPVNLTVTPRWLEKRGVKGDVEVEYVVGERSGGEAFGSFLYDRDVREGTRQTPFRRERWATQGDHEFFLPGEARALARWNLVSDNSYPNDFDDFAGFRSERFLPSEALAEGTLGGAGAFGLHGLASYRDGLANPDDSDRDDYLLQRLPELAGAAVAQELPFFRWLVPALDVEYVYFHQRDRPQDRFPDARLVTSDGRFFDSGIDGLPDSDEQGRVPNLPGPDRNFDNAGLPGGTENDGLFQEGELLADQGHRVTLRPRLAAPVRLFDALELYPEVGWHETLYGSDAEGFERRGLLTGRADLRTRVRGRLGPLTHLLEPRLGWALVTDVGQRGNPLYVPRPALAQARVRQLALDNVTRDPADRIEAFNGLSFAVGNRLYGEDAALLADFTLSALYDFERGRFDDVFLDGRAFPHEWATLRFGLGVDPRQGRLSEGLMNVAFRDDRGDRFTLGYRYLREIPRFFEAFPGENRRYDGFTEEFEAVNQIDGGFRVAITRNWAVVYRAAFSFERGLLLGNEGGIEYVSKCDCWAVRLEVRQSRSRGFSFGFRYSFRGLGDDSRSPFEQVGRGTDLGFLDHL